MIFSCFLYIVEEIGVLRWYIIEDTVKENFKFEFLLLSTDFHISYPKSWLPDGVLE